MSQGALAGDDPHDLDVHAPFGFVVTDADWTIRTVNRTLLAMLGRTRDDVVGRPLPALLSMSDRIFHETHYRPRLELQGSIKEVAARLIDADGQRRPVLLGSVLVRDDAGTTTSIRTGVVELTDRHRWEEELLLARRRAEASERRERELQRLLAELATAATTRDVARVLRSFAADVLSATGCELWLLDRAGRTLTRSDPERGTRTIDANGDRSEARALRDGREHIGPDGSVLVPLHTGSQRMGVLAVERDGAPPLDHDTTALVRSIGQQAAQVLERAQLYEQKDWILGMVAHDLRTPLATVGGFARTLQRTYGQQLDTTATHMLERLVATSDRLSRLTDDLLDTAVLSRGSLQLDTSLRPLGPLVAAAVEDHQPIAAAKRITLRLDDRSRDARARIDADRMVQVVDNLVSNALKFSPPGTSVSVTVTADADRVEVAVADHGPGIVDAERARLFTPLGRTSNVPTAGESSTGLGLVITRRLVEAHAGGIDLVASADVGATFVFWLPRER